MNGKYDLDCDLFLSSMKVVEEDMINIVQEKIQTL